MLPLFFGRPISHFFLGPEHFEEAVGYLELHRLHEAALAMWRNTEHYKVYSYDLLIVQMAHSVHRRCWSSMVITSLNAGNSDKQLPVRVGPCLLICEFMHDTLVLVEAGNLTKAMISHEKALQWQELFCLAAQVEMADEDVIDMGCRVAGVCLNRYLMLMSLIFFLNLQRI